MEMTVKIEESAPDGGDGNSGWVVVNVKMVLGLLGAAACLGWIAITLMAGPLSSPDTEIEFQSVIAHITFLAGIVVALGASVPLSDFWSSHRVAYLIASAVLIAAGIAIAFFFPIDRVFLWIGFAASGLGAGALHTLYGEYLSKYFANGIEPYIHSVLLIAVIFVAGYFFIAEDYRLAYWLIVAAISFIGYLSQMLFYKVHKLPYVKWKESRPRSKVRMRSYYSTASSGVMLGFAIGATFTIGGGDQTAFLIGAFVVAAACAFLLIDSMNKRFLGEKVSMNWFLPASAFLAFPMLFVSPSIAFAFAVLMACFSLLPTSCSLSAICRHIHICDLAAIGQFGFGRLFNFVGILIGLAMGYIGFSHLMVSFMGHYAITAAICAFMLFAIVSCSFIMVEDNYPTDERIHVVENEAGDKTVTVGPGTPIHALATPEPALADSLDEPRIGAFQMKCDIVAEKYGLSKRQAEVLNMLARGRGADYITEKLVISPHTAKAHTYNIYLKLDVHSRQELMDLVEATEVTEEDFARARARDRAS